MSLFSESSEEFDCEHIKETMSSSLSNANVAEKRDQWLDRFDGSPMKFYAQTHDV